VRAYSGSLRTYASLPTRSVSSALHEEALEAQASQPPPEPKEVVLVKINWGVKRTKWDNLPIYQSKRGNEVKISGIVGDIQELATDLRHEFDLPTGSVTINEITNKVIVKGITVSRVAAFMRKRSF